jgi:TonB family protein
MKDTVKKETGEGQDTIGKGTGKGNGNGSGTGDPLSLNDLNFNTANANKYNIVTRIGVPPRFPGGEKSRERFLQKNMIYPEFAQKNKIEGPVYVTFIVEADSTITNIKILQGIGSKCDEEAVRVVGMMPKWIPGTKNGVPVRFQITMPLIFTLHSL